jgi:REP element-mobilizing transposase RayT
MPRPSRNLKPGFCYHITTRCNGREFRLVAPDCKKIILYALHRALGKFSFRLYAICIMSNHVHYLLKPRVPEDLPRIDAVDQLVYGHVFEQTAQANRPFLGKAVSQLRLP